jgi:hypothetical protein
MIRKLAIVLVVLGVFCGLSARAQAGSGAATPSAQVAAPAPSTSLARHDFLYAGEAKQRNMYIVRGGKVVWSYSDPDGKGEISDAVMLSNGNILFAHQFGVTLITPEKKVLWNYDAPKGFEVHTAVPIGKERVLYIQNGDPAVLRVVNIVTGATEKEIKLKTKMPPVTHPQFRRARLTPQGTVLVGHFDLNKVVEYDSDGNELWSFPGVGGLWSVGQLDNGNILVTDGKGTREVTRRGDTVWSWGKADSPQYKYGYLQTSWRLPNGNTVVNNWMNEWSVDPKDMVGTMQAIELTPSKQVVWELSSWTNPNLGPCTTIQFLDPGAPAAEDVHFGEFK